MRYQIEVQGLIDDSWSEWFSGLEITVASDPGCQPITVFTGWIADQATLRGILTRIWDLNLTVLSFACLPFDEDEKANSIRRQGG